MVAIRAKNLGQTVGIPFVDGVLEAVGRSKMPYSPFAQGCGVIPGDVAAVDVVAPRKTVTVRACWEVDGSDTRSLLMVYDRYGGSKTYFALRQATAKGG